MSCMVDGSPDAPLLIIGMAPGREELAMDRPFVGGSGKLLWRQLKKHGIDRADCYIINCIGEWPDGTDGNPTKDQYDRYWDLFDSAVGQSKARVALLLGKAALWRFTGITGGIVDWRGYLLEKTDSCLLQRTVTRQSTYKTSNSKRGIKKGDPKVEKIKATVPPTWPDSVQWAIATLHPAAILRTGFSQLPALASDIARTGRALKGNLAFDPSPVWQDCPPNIVSPGFSKDIPPAYKPGEPVTFDIETGGADNSIITRIGCTDSKYVWTSHWDDEARRIFRIMMRYVGPENPATAFNIAFDAPRLNAADCPVPEPWFCLMMAAQTIQPDLKKSLNFVGSLYLDKKRHKHLSELDPTYYNAMDALDNKRLYPILRDELIRTGQYELFTKRMMPVLPVFVDMTRRGIKVDDEFRKSWITSLMEQSAELSVKWQALTQGQKTSGSRLTDWMYGDLGLPTQYHKHGGITTEVSGLQKMLLKERLNEHQRQVIQTLLELRRINKDLKTYAEVEVSSDGCVHPGFLPAGKDDDAFGKGIAGTGRPTASNPNIQNQPASARRMYVAHSPNQRLMEADFSQIEARILAHLSGDSMLQQAIDAGLHTTNMAILGVDKTRAKGGFYGWAYGAGKRTLRNSFVAKGYDIDESECEALLRGFDRAYEVSKRFMDRIAREAATRYYLTNPFGRRRYFLGGTEQAPAARDFLPQSTAADIGWSVLRPLADELRALDARVLAWVHDSVLIEYTRGREAEVAECLRDIMEQPWPELDGLSIPISIKTGDNWGEMNELAA